MVPGRRKEKREKLGLGDDARSQYSSAAKAKLQQQKGLMYDCEYNISDI